MVGRVMEYAGRLVLVLRESGRNVLGDPFYEVMRLEDGDTQRVISLRLVDEPAGSFAKVLGFNLREPFSP